VRRQGILFDHRSHRFQPPLGTSASAVPATVAADQQSPSPDQIPSPTPASTPTEVAIAPPPTNGPPCAPFVVTSFTARAGSAPRSVSLAWTISGGCLDMTGAIGGQFVAPMSSQNWVIPVHSPPPFYTDHPQRPAGSQQCLFRIHYSLIFNGVAPDGGAPRPAFTDVDNLNLC